MKKSDRFDVRLSVDPDRGKVYPEEQEDEPFVIVALGDFRGQSAAGPIRALGERKLEVIDCDNFDEVLARFGPCWQGTIEDLPNSPGSGGPVQHVLRTMEDFHPDRILEQTRPLARLLEARRALGDPAKADAVAAELSKWAVPPADAGHGARPSGAAVPSPNISPSELLNLMLGEGEARAAATRKDPWAEGLQALLRDAVAPHVVKIDFARTEAFARAIDVQLTRYLQAILRDPAFKRLEAAWRGLAWLVRAAETGPELKIYIVQATREDLLDDMYAHGEPEESGLARLLLEPSSVRGGMRPALLIGNYEFSGELEDLALLERIGGIAKKLGAPFLAAASPALFGCSAYAGISSPSVVERIGHTESQAWHALRASACAQCLALALPRVLCRIPYGVDTDRIESFDFEETIRGHDDLVWGNPAFWVAGVIAQSFAGEGWALDLSRGVARIDGLPFYAYKEGGETKAVPCAEQLLTERTVEALELAGLIPLISYRDRDLVSLPCMQSIAEPRAPLSWA